MIQYSNYLIINILYIYIKILKSLDACRVKKSSKVTPKEINILIKCVPP